MGDTVKCNFCGALEDWEDFHVWGCEVCDKVFCDDCAPAGSDPMNPRKLILCPECAAGVGRSASQTRSARCSHPGG